MTHRFRWTSAAAAALVVFITTVGVSGFSRTEAVASGFSRTETVTSGFSRTETVASGFSRTETVASGFSRTETVASGFSRTETVASGFSRTETVASGFSRTSAQASRSVKSGVYTAEQARRGRDDYRKRCVLCHLDNGQGRGAEPEIVGQSLEREGDAEAPAVAGDEFLEKWKGQDARALYDKMAATMPPGGAGTLKPQEYVDVLAHLLELSKLPAGQQELPAARDQLALITIER